MASEDVISHQVLFLADATHPPLAFQMMYAGTKLSLVKEADLTKVFEIRDLEELTDEWLKLKLLK